METLFFLAEARAMLFMARVIGVIPDELVKRIEQILRATKCSSNELPNGHFVGPRRGTVSPSSEHIVDIIDDRHIIQVEQFIYHESKDDADFDPMTEEMYEPLDDKFWQSAEPAEQLVFHTKAEIVDYCEDNELNLSPEQIEKLEAMRIDYGGELFESVVAGYAQLQSDHCRHLNFTADLYVDGKEKRASMMQLIRQTFAANPGTVKSAFSDNASAFGRHPATTLAIVDDVVMAGRRDVLATLKVETHNHPTSIAPFPGAATGSGGRIRDNMGVGSGSTPVAGTAAYFVPDLRLEEAETAARPWMHDDPLTMLIKASDGASHYGNTFGEPVISGSLVTDEVKVAGQLHAYDKCIMASGGIGDVFEENLEKQPPEKGWRIILLGGADYRIGIGGGSGSSTELGNNSSAKDFNSVQRANPEMQRRVANVITTCSKMRKNPLKSVHDHGAGGHMCCFAEIVDTAGGKIDMDTFPIRDEPLSIPEILINESQERMGVLVAPEDVASVMTVARRENCPAYDVGEITGDGWLVYTRRSEVVFRAKVEDLTGGNHIAVRDTTRRPELKPLRMDAARPIAYYLERVLKRPTVGSKRFLTDKVDRSVGGRIVAQQCIGPEQLPVGDYGMISADLDPDNNNGIAVALGSAPIASLIDPAAGARLAVAEALTNLLGSGAKLKDVTLSANWQWPFRLHGEAARMYTAVKAVRDFCLVLGINVSTGKDSMSMDQRYPDGTHVAAPGTLLVTATANVRNIRNRVSPMFDDSRGSWLAWMDMSSSSSSELGGSQLALSLGQLGDRIPDVDPIAFRAQYESLERSIESRGIYALHDISEGGLITTLTEMALVNDSRSMFINGLSQYDNDQLLRMLFSEAPGVVIQTDRYRQELQALYPGSFHILGEIRDTDARLPEKMRDGITISSSSDAYGTIPLADCRKWWSEPSMKVEEGQCDASVIADLRGSIDHHHRRLNASGLKHRP